MKHAFARQLRRNQTDAECRLWYVLRNRRLAGGKFRRQQPIGPYIVDFACFALSLIIELDGSQHDHPENVEADRVRTAYLKRQGYRVLRFRNHELVDSFDGVLDAIFQALELAKQKAR